MSDPTLNQDEIDALLADVGGLSDSGSPAPAPAESASVDDILASVSSDSGPAEIADDPFSGGGFSDSAGDDLAAMLDASPAEPVHQAAPAHAAPEAAHESVAIDFSKKNIDVLLDVPLQVVVELGRSEMPIQKVLELGPGSIVELNRMSGEPINILVNGKLVAKGEVVVVDENFGVKITHIISPMERLSQLN